MALIIEDGTIVSGADTYISLVDATTYHSSRGNSAWASAVSDPVREQALRRAADFLDMNFYTRWKGAQIQPLTQARQWPRAGVRVSQEQVYYDVPPSFYDTQYSGFLAITTIPQKLKDAQCELALRALSGPLAPDLKRGGKVSSVTVGPITTVYEQGAPAETVYSLINKLLSPLLKPRSSRLERS